MFRATARRMGDPEPEGRQCDTAELAARMLVILLKAHGWTGSEQEVVDTLAAGQPVEFKGFVYRVTDETGDKA